MKIALATDAWAPQVNGVVRTLMTTVDRLRQRGHEVEILSPDQFRTIACPGYQEIRLAIAPRFRIAKRLKAFQPDITHIATEGPIGWAVRGWCLRHNIPYTTAFHTRFPDYAAVRTGLSPDVFWPIMRRFHARSQAVLAATGRLAEELNGRSIERTRLWARGVDLTLFHPNNPPLPELADLPKPIQLYVGRVAIEKNLEAFLATKVEGTKVVVGDGPALNMLSARFPNAYFLGALHGQKLASAYASADVFVFPSLTDTFGLVMIEALASGLPVAAFPVPGPLDILGDDGRGCYGRGEPVGCLDWDLAAAIRTASTLSPADCVAYGAQFDWDETVTQFETILSSVTSQTSPQRLQPTTVRSAALAHPIL